MCASEVMVMHRAKPGCDLTAENMSKNVVLLELTKNIVEPRP